jgi:hypothetical protein
VKNVSLNRVIDPSIPFTVDQIQSAYDVVGYDNRQVQVTATANLQTGSITATDMTPCDLLLMSTLKIYRKAQKSSGIIAFTHLTPPYSNFGLNGGIVKCSTPDLAHVDQGHGS